MKKNNKFRNNGNSNAYSLNYKFDSVSPAGKYNGTALDLIKRYNELAKEAHSSGNYIEMEVFRQYAEHYRKIVTEINERKNMRQDITTTPPTSNQPEQTTDGTAACPCASSEITQPEKPKQNHPESNALKETAPIKKSFKIVEIKTSAEDMISTERAQHSNAESNDTDLQKAKPSSPRPKRQARRKNEPSSDNEVKTVAAV